MCGVVGVINRKRSVSWSASGLYALQHRGHDSCGVAYLNETGEIDVIHGKGAVADVLPSDLTETIDATVSLGQNLYTTYGMKHSPQPFAGRFWDTDGGVHHIALAHNGQVCGIEKLRRVYPVMYSSHSDSELIFALLPHMPGDTMKDKIFHLVRKLEGAFSLLFIVDGSLIAVRDPHGFRPLIFGKGSDGAMMFASEINAFDLMDGEFIRQVEPGEMIIADPDGKVTEVCFTDPKPELAQCVFEHIYFARPDNQLFGKPAYTVQKKLGYQLGLEMKGKVEADVIVPVPDSANVAALGFSEAMGVPLEYGLLRHHFASRTFITRGQKNRERAVRLKFNVVKDVIQDRRVILADDSLVRSTTSKILIKMLRKGRAKEIHLALFSPDISHSCTYGINTPTQEELIAFNYQCDHKKIAKIIGADSVNYLSLPGLREVMQPNACDYCYACMNGDYPVPIDGSDRPGTS